MQNELNNPLFNENNQEGMTRNESGLSFHLVNYHDKKGSFINEVDNQQGENNYDNKGLGLIMTPNNRVQQDRDRELGFSAGKNYGQKDSYSNVISINDNDTGGRLRFIKGNKKGFLYMLISSSCFSISAFLVKKVENNSISELELMFYRSLFIILILFIIYKLSQREEHPDNEIQEYSKNNITFINVNERNFVKIYSILNSIIIYSYFYGIKQMPLYEAISLQNCSLFFTGIFACFAISQQPKFQAKEIACTILIAIGVYLISYSAPLKATIICIIGGSFVQALIYQIIRKFEANTQFMTLLFYTSFIQLIVSPILIIFLDKFHHISLSDIFLIAVMSFLQIVGTRYLQESFMAFSEGRFLNFHVQIQIIFTILLGHFFLKDAIELHALTGSVFIVISSIMMILRFKQTVDL